MSYPHTPPCRATILGAALSLAVVTIPASAAVKTWDGAGADDNWQTGANWNADTAPLPDDQLVFTGAVRLNPSNNFPAATVFNGITFPAAAGAFTLSGNALTLTRGISAGNGTVSGGTISNSSTAIQNLSLPVQLSSGKYTVVSAAGSGGMNLSGAFTHSPNSTVVFTRTGGSINFIGSGLANDPSGILGGWAVIGNDWATLDAGKNVVPYTGYTTIANGTITSGPTLNYHYNDATAGADITADTPGGTTFINTLAADINVARVLTVTGTLAFGSQGGIYRQGSSTGTSIFRVTNGTLTASGGGALTFWNATNSAGGFAETNNSLRIDSVIADDAGSPVSVNIQGYLDIRGANTYTGGTFINQGRVQTGGLSTFGTGPVTVYPGGQAFLNQAGAWNNPMTISGIGSTEGPNGGVTGPGAIRLGSTANLAAQVTLAGNTRITSSSVAGPSISGRITGTGALELTSFATTNSVIVLSNPGTTPNDWNGPLTISSLSGSRAAIIRLGANEQVPDNTTVTLTATTNTGSSRFTTFDLNGFNETFGPLNGGISTTTLLSNGVGTSTLTLGSGGGSGDFGGTVADVIGSTMNLVKTGSGKQILRGPVQLFGTTTVNGGTLEIIGDYFGIGDITIGNGAKLEANALLPANVTLSGGGTLEPSGVNNGIASITGNLTLESGSILNLKTGGLPNPPLIVTGVIAPSGGAGSVTVNLSGPALPPGQHQLISYSGGGSLGGTGITAFTLGTVPPRFNAALINDTGSGAIVLNVAGSDRPVWRGSLDNEWSTNVLAAPKNWVLSSNSATTTDYLSGDSPLFNDGATSTAPDISIADVSIGEVLFDNNTKAYTVTGSKGMTGSGKLVKQGAGKLTIANPNTFTGGTTIAPGSGTVELVNGGSLGSGGVVNDSILEFNRSDNSAHANAISGEGELRHTGTGTTTLSGAGSFTGASTVSAGTLRIGSSTALGAIPGGDVTVSSGAAIDVGGNTTANSIDLGQKQVIVTGDGPTGAGVLVNTGTVTQQNSFEKIRLTGNSSFGGTNRFDIRAATPGAGNPNTAILELGSHTLRKRGPSQFTTVATEIQGSGASIIVEQGLLAIETSTNTRGTGSIICEPGTSMQFYQNGNVISEDFVGVIWPITLREGVNFGSANTTQAMVPAPINLEGNVNLVPFNAAVPSPTFNNPLLLTGAITESGGSFSITKLGVNRTTLDGIGSTYTGPTLVNAGLLEVTGSVTASPFTVAVGATLAGTGLIGGTVKTNGILAPGLAAVTPIGTFSTGTVTLSGTASLVIQIDSIAIVSDELAVTGGINLGGATLNVTDLSSSTLPESTKLVIASYTGSLTGAFANAPDGGTLTVGLNSFKIDYDEVVSGRTSITLTSIPELNYDQWASFHGLDGTNNGKSADPDHDGLSNFVEFGLDLDPLDSGSGGKIRSLVSDVDPGAGVAQAFTLTVAMRTSANFTGSAPGDLLSLPIHNIVYRVEGSTDFGGFPLDIAEITPALSAGMPNPSSGWSYRTFRLPGSPGNPHPKAFLRIDVTEDTP